MKRQADIEKKIDELAFDNSSMLSSELLDSLENIPAYMEYKNRKKNKALISFMSISVICLLCCNIFLFQKQNQQENDDSFSSYYSNYNEIDIYEN